MTELQFCPSCHTHPCQCRTTSAVFNPIVPAADAPPKPTEEMVEKAARLIHAAMFDEDGDDVLIKAGVRTHWQDYKLHAECVLREIAALDRLKEETDGS